MSEFLTPLCLLAACLAVKIFLERVALPRTNRKIAEAYARIVYPRAIVEYLEEDDEWIATVPGLDGLMGTGETEADALSDLYDGTVAWVKVRLEHNLPIPGVPQ